MTELLVKLRDSAPGPSVSPEALLDAAKVIAIEWGAKPGDMAAVAYVAACIASGALIGGMERLPPGRPVDLKLDTAVIHDPTLNGEGKH